ncbi:DUF551 domain-containing protein [Escherichia coli]|uniref:DUF551 domain-containing protein n=1 Tax=Escherichia coli TaxID=562 RepID=UPI0028D9C906|nr:DUF551 domain-containing protein [Escherichia coli]MDT8470926.1 DUF551 domain-containing protein [Escherichia coli]MDT8482899.1 DUF551 domain-containing protein [Escherichia coli]
MSNIDKQSVQAVADLKAGYTLGHADVAMLNELARIALASLEADPVGEVVLGEYDDCGCHPDARVVCIAADGQADWENFKDGTRLYTAPPAPVSRDEMTPKPAVPDKRTWLFYCEKYPEMPMGDAIIRSVEWNACRAAMLQGKSEQPQNAQQNIPENIPGGNSPVTPDGWISCSDRMPEDTKMLLAFSQGEIVAAYWNWVVNPIDYKKYRAFTYLSGNILDDVTHWMPLPEPPQEVK